MEKQMWGDMLGVLKDIGAYLAKQDAIQERASVDKAPKISETQKPIKGDTDVSHGFGPGKGVAKATLIKEEAPFGLNHSEPRAAGQEAFTPDASEGSSQLSKEDGLEERFQEEPQGDEDEEYTEDEEEEEDEGMGGGEDEGYGDPSEEDVEELKSLLKDIRKSLVSQSKTSANVPISKEYLKKAIQPMIKEEAQRMIRKMGFTPSRPDVVRYGVDDNSALQKSMDGKEVNKGDEIGKVVEDLSHMSWAKLGALREQTGQFNPFYK